MLEEGLWQTQGATPDQTISAAISQDVKNDPQSPFVRVGKGIYALRESMPIDAKAPRPKSEPQSDAPSSTLSFTDAAQKILRESAGKKPMHYRAITTSGMDAGLIETSGKTPEATMYSVIYQEIERQKARGERPRFVLHGEGYVGLSEWMSEGLAFQVERHNRKVREELLQRLHEMPPERFEATIASLLVALGFEDVIVTPATSDGGIDVRGVLVSGDVVRTKMAVQVKRWKRNVQAPTVQQVRGSLGAHEQGLIVTTSDFSSGAYSEAERPDATPVGLMNGELMVALLVEHDIGVTRNDISILEQCGLELIDPDTCGS